MVVLEKLEGRFSLKAKVFNAFSVILGDIF